MKNIKSSITLVNNFRNFIIKLNFLLIKLTRKNVLIAFSGGQDSICLIILIFQLAYQFNLYFNIILCNHFWSLENLYKLSHACKVSFIFNKKIFFALAIKKNFTEKNARFWRYSLIYRISQFYSYEITLTGHTKTDQIETLLLNLFRGSSKSGLSIFFHSHFLMNKSTKEIFLSERDFNEKKNKD